MIPTDLAEAEQIIEVSIQDAELDVPGLIGKIWGSLLLEEGGSEGEMFAKARVQVVFVVDEVLIDR